MNSSKTPKKAIKMEFFQLPDGSYDLNAPTEFLALDWVDWINIPLRPYDPESSVRTAKLEIRAPQVVICSKYNKVPPKTFRPTKKNLYERYGGRCIWTGEIVPYKQATIEHMHPRSKGGKNTWKNLAIAAPKLNRKKSDKSVEEFVSETGMKPKYKLSEPPATSVALLIKEALHPEWRPFLLNNK